MRALFFSGIIFVIWRKPPRWVILTMIATGVLILISKINAPEFDTILAGTIIQTLLWIPLLAYLVSHIGISALPEMRTRQIFAVIYGGWLLVVTATVAASTAMNIFALGKLVIS